MGLFNFFRKNKKQRYLVDKTQVDRAYVENRFQFLVDNGYKYEYYSKYAEREFIYSLKNCRVEVFLDGYMFDCVIQTKDCQRANITKNPLITKEFQDKFLVASNQERINMTVNLIQEHSEEFLLR